MGFCTGIFQILLFVFNFACLVVGLALLIVGIVYKLNIDEFTQHLDEISSSLGLIPVLLIVFGCVIIVISFLGCCGAIRKNSCMLTTYAVILVIILVLQIAFFIYAFVQANEDSWLYNRIEEALEHVFERDSNLGAIDFIQRNLECCGLDGMFHPNTNIRDTCFAEDAFRPFLRGCRGAFLDFAVSAMNVIGIVAASLAAIELLGAVFALCIARKKY